ncbi:MAG: GIY-YIG nuclease family protein [Anaerolineaceae bacterium]|nr:GIY-YIG nuclease family protein [Anaerolineaceae bacterium]
MKLQLYFCYIVICADGTFYTGWTTDPERRVKEHNYRKNGAVYTRLRRPVSLAYLESCVNRREAMKRELAIKKLTRKKKAALITTYKLRQENDSRE